MYEDVHEAIVSKQDNCGLTVPLFSKQAAQRPAEETHRNNTAELITQALTEPRRVLPGQRQQERLGLLRFSLTPLLFNLMYPQ